MRPEPSLRDVQARRFQVRVLRPNPPHVTLEVDHIIPRAEGGGDEPENLIRACMDCNRGKGAVPLDVEPEAVPDLEQRALLISEREEQLRAYHAALEESARRRDDQFGRVWNAWFEIWGASELPRRQTPGKAALRRYIDDLGEREVMLALEVVEQKFPRYPSNSAVRYLFGVLKWKLGRLEGRVVECVYCKREMLLDPDEDATAEWYHVQCQEERVG